MSIYKKWLNIAMIFMLLISLISPSVALADEIDSTELESLVTDPVFQTSEESSLVSPDTIPSSTTSDSTELPVTSSNIDEPTGTMIISIEKFTLGQGYVVAPVQVPIYSGDKVGHVVARLLGDGNYNDGQTEANISYLANLKDSATTSNIPQFILAEIAKEKATVTEKTNSAWLGQFDYTQMSGWMFTANNQVPNVGMSDVDAKDGDVIRLQFTVYGYGSDLGIGYAGSYIQVANKDALTAEVAKINSATNKAEILAKDSVKTAYEAAYEQLTNLESSQVNVDKALEQLTTALNEKETIIQVDKIALQAATEQAELKKADVKVSTDGKDIEQAVYWVTQEALDTYIALIVSAQQLLAEEAATQEASDAKVLALNQGSTTFEQAKKAGLKTEAAVETEVTFTVAPKTVSLKIYDTSNQEVAIGAGQVDKYNVYTANLLAGDYRYEGFTQDNKSVGGGKLTITAEPNQAYEFRQLNFKASNSGWVVNEDYTIHVGQDSLQDTSLKFGELTSSGQTPVFALVGKTLFYTLTPHTKHEEMMEFSDKMEVKMATSAQSMSKAIAFSGNVKFTVPEDAELFLGQKSKHFVEFTEQKPESVVLTDGLKTYSYKLLNNKEYNYRVSQAGKLTNTGVFKATGENKALEITKEQLEIVSPKSILNKGTYLEGNLYLNINEQNHLKLNEGEQFKLLPLRNWQALIEGISNYFFEPDFHYEVIQGEDVVAIGPGKPGSYATVNALKNGTAIVKVTYDALKVNGSTYVKDANDAFSAIWPENVGLFVVTVGQGETGISTGILSNVERNKKANETVIKNLQNGVFDADIDSVYYAEGEKGAYFTFTPTAGTTVSVLRPEINHAAGTVSYGSAEFSAADVTANTDGSTTILLAEGRNIVKVEKDGKAEYHVMTARSLAINIENITRPSEKIGAGDQVKVTFNGLSFPANKLAGIYNFRGQLQFDGGPEKTPISGSAVQYNLTTSGNSVTFTIPENHVGDYRLQDGRIGLSFFGSPIGDHRNIDPAVGKNPNFSAVQVEGYYSIFPEITIIEETVVEAVEKTALQVSIEKAEKNKADVHVSTDGKDMAQAAYWVTQEELDVYTALILSAQQLLAKETATQDAIDAKVLALNQGSDTFEQVKKAGLKSDETYTTEQAYHSVGKYMLENLPNPRFGNEWWIITLARGGYTVPAGYYETYYQNVVEHVVLNKGVLDKRKYTEYSRLIIALTAIGKDPTNVGGYNLIDQLANFDKVVWQGVNGAYYALIALDTKNFELPTAATTTREKLIDFIVSRQLEDNGWALSGTKADLDMTAMAIQSLAPYYTSNPQVKQAVDEALTTLASLQAENQSQSVESIAQAVTALASLGIDPNKDSRFGKVIENIMTYYHAKDGGFKHVLTETATNGMATEQVGYTLAAYHRLLNGQTTLYDMSDVKLDVPSTPPTEVEKPTPSTPPTQPDVSEQIGTVYTTIQIDSSSTPLSMTPVELQQGDSAFDLLVRVTNMHGIPLSYRTTSYGVYIDGISGVHEFDRGPLSGWMYRVNGVFPSYSADSYTLQPNDVVEWLYTEDLGKDIGGYVEDTVTEKPKDEPKPPVTDDNQPLPNEEVDVPVEKTDWKLDCKTIQQYIEQNKQVITLQVAPEVVVEIPMAALQQIQLQDDEYVQVAVDVKGNSIVTSIVVTDGETKKPWSTGKEYVKVKLLAFPVTANSVVAQLLNNELRAVPHQIENGEMVIFTKGSGEYTVTEKAVTFNDIVKHGNKADIEFLANRLIVNGKDASTFAPNAAITRAQFGAMISRALGLTANETAIFTDTKGKWYEQEIQALLEAGITKGKTASTFDPEASMTRQQAAAFMANILAYVGYEAKPAGLTYADAAAIQDQHKEAVALVASLGIMTGKEDGKFDAKGELTRAQMAKILKRTLQVAGLL